jgi:uncharacterized protein (DUF952 family)
VADERSAQGSDLIYHVTFASDWRSAQSEGEYTLSTRGARLEDEGYIHASFAHQVERVGTYVFGDAPEPVVVLVIDPGLLDCPVRVENLEGGTEGFPHIYGPLPTAAVVDVHEARLDGNQLVVEDLTRNQ